MAITEQRAINRDRSGNGDREEMPADFSKIKGVGQSTAQAFLKLGITKFGDLAAFTSEDLAELLKTGGLAISPQRISRDNWIGQARALAFPARTQPQEKGQFEAPWKGDAGWREIADFFVSFGYQITPSGEKRLITRAAHSQSGDGHKDWEGVEKETIDRYLHWMLEQAGLPSNLAKDVSAEAEQAQLVEPAPGANLTIRDIRETQVLREGGSRLETAIRIEAGYQLTAAALALAEEDSAFCVEVYLINLRNNQPRLSASCLHRFQPGELRYTIGLEFPRPEPGRYQIYLASSPIETIEASARIKGPVLRIE